MDSLTLAIIILVGLVVVGTVVVVLRRSWGGSLDRSYRPPVSPTALAQPRPLAGHELAEVSALLAGGNKIAAIKRYRELTGLGLKEAKDAVEAIERSGLPSPTTQSSLQDQGANMRQAVARSDLAEVIVMLRGGNKIEAIKRYRELTGLGLKEAKDAVEAIERSGTLPDALPAAAAPDPGVGRRDLSAADLAEIRALRDRGNKIEAIKRYRELTGLGLKEAKDYVESL